VDPYESEKEQLETLRRWWRENGKALVAGVVLGLGALFGWRAWQDWKLERAAAASGLYEQLLERHGAGDADAVAVLVERLAREHGGSAYAVMGRLTLAALLAAEGRLDDAEGHLRQALAGAPDEAFAATARLQLARLLAARGKREEAERLAGEPVPDAFEPLRAELRGDLAAARGDAEEARAAYEAALRALGPASPLGRLVELKRDDLGVPPQHADSPPVKAGAASGEGAEKARQGGEAQP